MKTCGSFFPLWAKSYRSLHNVCLELLGMCACSQENWLSSCRGVPVGILFLGHPVWMKFSTRSAINVFSVCSRSMFLSVFNESGKIVALFVKPWRCDACWIPCWWHKIMLQTPEDHFVGWIRQRFAIGDAQMDIQDETDETVYQIKEGNLWPVVCSETFKRGVDGF